jgi:hypothetical protein
VLLQGIPELQQLLAYTAADVVHYAVDRWAPWREGLGGFRVEGADLQHTPLMQTCNIYL